MAVDLSEGGFDELVCVGGPSDGLRVRLPCSHEFLRVPVPAPPPVPGRAAMAADWTFHCTVYERQIWRAGDDVCSVLVPRGLTRAEAFGRLIDGYRPAQA